VGGGRRRDQRGRVVAASAAPGRARSRSRTRSTPPRRGRSSVTRYPARVSDSGTSRLGQSTSRIDATSGEPRMNASLPTSPERAPRRTRARQSGPRGHTPMARTAPSRPGPRM
jgi:hypothetical protein